MAGFSLSQLNSNAQIYVAGGLRLADALGVIIAGILAFVAREGSFPVDTSYVAALGLCTLLTINFMGLADLYSLRTLRSPAGQVGRIVGAWVVVLMALLAFGFFTKTSHEFSRIWFLLWATMGLTALFLNRFVGAMIVARLNRKGRLRARVAIVGAGGIGQRLAEHLSGHGAKGSTVVGVWDDRGSRVPQAISGFDVRGTVDDLIAYARENEIDDIIIALPWQASARIRQVARQLYVVPANVRICPDLVGFGIPLRGFSSMEGVPLLNIYERPLSGWSLVTKALEDRALAALLLLLFTPLMLLVALAIKLDSRGPVLFRQRRYGFNNNPFDVYKFRSMRAGGNDDPNVPQAMRNDPRVTRVGAFLRRTSLDELPQLINVLVGDMSIVGPRPHAVAHNEKYARLIDEYMCRHRVKPGITGWAQINGWRGETETPEKMSMRVQYDLYYIENWSLLFDLRILFMTAFVGFTNRNAY